MDNNDAKIVSKLLEKYVSLGDLYNEMRYDTPVSMQALTINMMKYVMDPENKATVSDLVLLCTVIMGDAYSSTSTELIEKRRIPL